MLGPPLPAELIAQHVILSEDYTVHLTNSEVPERPIHKGKWLAAAGDLIACQADSTENWCDLTEFIGQAGD